MKKWLIIAITIVVLALAGGSYYYFAGKSKTTAKGMSIDNIVKSSVQLPELTTNLKSDNLIKLSLELQTDSTKAKDELTKREFQVNNVVIEELSDLTKSQLTGKKGLNRLQQDLKQKITSLMNDGSVVQVYITSYVVQ